LIDSTVSDRISLLVVLHYDSCRFSSGRVVVSIAIQILRKKYVPIQGVVEMYRMSRFVVGGSVVNY
jgi:hypothetical protein